MGFMPVLIAASVLRSKGLLLDGRSIPDNGDDDDDVSDVPVIALGVVADILCVGTIVAAICSRDWLLCAGVGALLAAHIGLLYWLSKKFGSRCHVDELTTRACSRGRTQVCDCTSLCVRVTVHAEHGRGGVCTRFWRAFVL